MSQNPVWLKRVAALALAVSVSVGCGDDSTGPVEIGIDPADAAASMEAVLDQFVVGNEGLQSINGFTDRIFDALGASVVALELLPRVDNGTLYETARRIRASVERTAGAGVAASIPAGKLGTWRFVPGSGYEIDPELETPANTARFLLYAVNEDLEPIVPLDSIGYLDLVDTTELPAVQMGISAVIRDAMLLNVDIVGSFTSTALDLDFDGFLSDGIEQLPIDLSVNGSSSAVTANFTLDLGALSATFSLTERGDNTGTFIVSFTDGTDTIQFRINVLAEQIGSEFIDTITDGSGVRYNGRTVAVITGTLDNPTLTNVSGSALTQEERQALRRLFLATGNLFEVYQTIVAFAILLLILGIA